MGEIFHGRRRKIGLLMLEMASTFAALRVSPDHGQTPRTRTAETP